MKKQDTLENQANYAYLALGSNLGSKINNLEYAKYKLSKKSGCSMIFRETDPGNFSGTIESGCKCYIQYGKDKTYVKSKVNVNKNSLMSEDSGYEIETDKKLWGSEFGPLIFKKLDNFDYFIDRNWC